MRAVSHPSNRELLLAADGELSSRQAARLRAHLHSCGHCRTRLDEIESTIAAFTHAHRAANHGLPPIAGPRALLKARMAQARISSHDWSWRTWRPNAAAIALLVVAFGALIGLRFHERQRIRDNSIARVTPRSSLTPGAIRVVTRDQVCSLGDENRPRVIPASLRQEVFQEYGMPQAQPDAFEVDYLVTPELGGTADIRNLWPQPYDAAIWNAHVKDALEDRLHTLVCSGEIDLATAQHDIALDWISAYKKYFHTDRPRD